MKKFLSILVFTISLTWPQAAFAEEKTDSTELGLQSEFLVVDEMFDVSPSVSNMTPADEVLGSERESEDQAEADLLPDGKLPSLPVTGDWKSAYNFVLEILLANPTLNAGINIDDAQGVVVIDTDPEGKDFLTSKLEGSSFGSLVTFGGQVSFGSGDKEIWHGGGSFQTVCTGAFPATNDGQIGVLTATHCFADTNTSPIAYEGNIIQSEKSAPASAGDITFIGLLGLTSGLTRTSGSTYEPMSWYRNPVVGESVCHFGITSGKACSTVRAKYQFAQVQGEPLANIAVVQSHVSSFGDSGGPWYTNTPVKVAVGVHLGAYIFDGFVRSVFTMISSLTFIPKTTETTVLILNGLQ